MSALRICRSLGIELRPSLLPFTPWSTLRDQVDLLDMIAANDLIDSVDPVQLTIRLLVPPGSLLLSLPEMRVHLLGYDPEGFSHLWQHPDAAWTGSRQRSQRWSPPMPTPVWSHGRPISRSAGSPRRPPPAPDYRGRTPAHRFQRNALLGRA